MSMHRISGHDLDGGAVDVLHKLYFRGEQESGGLPSKSGMSELVLLGWAQTDWDMALPHSLTSVGKLIAQLYYEAKAKRAAAVKAPCVSSDVLITAAARLALAS
ncbi:hypothetical protein D3C75_1141140 [compost metagenome]